MLCPLQSGIPYSSVFIWNQWFLNIVNNFRKDDCYFKSYIQIAFYLSAVVGFTDNYGINQQVLKSNGLT